ncbi:MAG: hypothetical protein O3A14_18825, partial [Cyanobacteria bacterium]|nr:hypothetical protein [Cyanobacteriota bacterium]
MGHFLHPNEPKPLAFRARPLPHQRQQLPWSQSFIPKAIPPIRRSRTKEMPVGWLHPSAAVVLSTLTLTAAMGQQFYRQPALQVGTIAPNTIVAPSNASVVDADTTEAQRTAARNGAAPVLTVDDTKNDQIK